MDILKVEHLTKSYGEGENKIIALNNVSFTVAKGEFVAVVGASGSGKSTLIHLIGGVDVPDSGKVIVGDRDIYSLNEEELAANGRISYGSNVKEVTTQVSEGTVDCGVIYCTDAYSAGLTASDYATPEMCGQVIYPAAVMKNSQYQEEAQAFLDFLQTDPCMEIFEEVGFSRVTEG